MTHLPAFLDTDKIKNTVSISQQLGTPVVVKFVCQFAADDEPVYYPYWCHFCCKSALRLLNENDPQRLEKKLVRFG